MALESSHDIRSGWRVAAAALLASVIVTMAPAARAQTVLNGNATQITNGGVPAAAPPRAPYQGQNAPRPPQGQIPTFQQETTTAPLTVQQVASLAGAPWSDGQLDRLSKTRVSTGGQPAPLEDGVLVARNFTGMVQVYDVQPRGVDMYFGVDLNPQNPTYIRKQRLIGDNSFGAPHAENFSIAGNIIPRQTQYYTAGLVNSDVDQLTRHQNLIQYVADNKLVAPNGLVNVQGTPAQYRPEAVELNRFLEGTCLRLVAGKPHWVVVPPVTNGTQPNLIAAVPNQSSMMMYAVGGVTKDSVLPDDTIGTIYTVAARAGDNTTMRQAEQTLAAINATGAGPAPLAPPLKMPVPENCGPIAAERAKYAQDHHVNVKFYLGNFQRKNGYTGGCPVPDPLIFPPPTLAPEGKNPDGRSGSLSPLPGAAAFAAAPPTSHTAADTLGRISGVKVTSVHTDGCAAGATPDQVRCSLDNLRSQRAVQTNIP